MNPDDVTSSRDVREGWDDWTYSERVDALHALANATLDQYGYDNDVTVDTGDTGDYNGYYDDGDIVLDPEIVEDPDPEHAIHVLNHETVHAMNDEDGIDDSSYNEDPSDDGTMDFTLEDLESFEAHQAVGDVARELDRDGFPPPADTAAGGSPVGGAAPTPGTTSGAAGGGESGGAVDVQEGDLSIEIDWASGVWVETTVDGAITQFDLFFAPPDGW